MWFRICFLFVWLAPVAFAHGAVEVVVHRGANAEAPENTIAAGKRCVELGVDYVEIDVRRSADGVYYVLHDATVDRTTDGSGRISELTSEEIDKLDAGSWYSSEFAGEPVPRLRDYLAWAQGKIKVYFDVKAADLPELIAVVRAYEFEDDSFFWFGNKLLAKRFRELAPDLPLKINASTPDAVREAKAAFNPQIIECGVDALTDELFAVCDEFGIDVMVRDGRNDPEAFKTAIVKGADLFNLDYPRAFLDVQRGLLSVDGVIDDIATRLYADFAVDELPELTHEDIFAAITPVEREALATRHVHFDVNVPVIVSVMRHTEQATVPFWLAESGFEKTDLSMTNIEGWAYEVWQKAFPAGHVGLGVNGFANHRPHYFVCVGPLNPDDEVELTNVHPAEFPIGWMADGATIYNDWTELVLRDVPEELKHQLLLTTIRGRSRLTHLVGGFRQTPYPSCDIPDQIVLSWTEDPQTSADVHWRGAANIDSGAVRYRKKGSDDDFQIAEAKIERVEDRFLANDRYCNKFHVTIRGLEPGTEYEYRAGFPSMEAWSDSSVFRTAPAEDEAFEFVVFGDTQSIEPWEPIVEAAQRYTPDARFQLIAGDVVGTGQYRDDWDRLFHVAQPITRKWPLMPALGNHDVIDGLGAGMWRASHALPLNGPPHLEPERVYAFEYSNALIVILDSGLEVIDQAAWLEETLAASDADWKFVIYHFPPYNYKHDYPKIEALWGYLYDKYGVDIAFEGHIHYYMRSKPIFRGRPQPVGSKGMVHVLTIAVPNRERDLPPAAYAAKQFTGVGVYQSVKVDGDTVTCQAIDADGNVLDRFTLSK